MLIKKIIEIIEYKELIKNFVIRDLKARYKGYVLGYLWSWLEPLITMLIFIFIFDIILKIKIENFPVYFLSGSIPWLFFSRSISSSVNSIVGNAGLIKNIYFPRVIYPLSVTLSNLANLILSLVVLIPIILLFNVNITYKALLLPLPLILMFFLVFGLALLFSCLNVYFRDISYISGFILRFWFYASPIFYNIEDRVSARLLDLYLLNPLAVILMLFRTALMGLNPPNIRSVLIASFVCILTFIVGLWLFLDKEDKMVKMI